MVQDFLFKFVQFLLSSFGIVMVEGFYSLIQVDFLNGSL